QDKINQAEAAYSEAVKLYADRFSPEKFSKAGQLKTDAKTAYDKGDFRGSAGLAVESMNLSLQAKVDSLKNASSIENDIAAQESRLDELKKDTYSSAAETELGTAAASIEKAKTAVKGNDYKSAYSELDTAKAALDKSSDLIRKKGMSARIEELRGIISSLLVQKGSDIIKGDLDRAATELTGAE